MRFHRVSQSAVAPPRDAPLHPRAGRDFYEMFSVKLCETSSRTLCLAGLFLPASSSPYLERNRRKFFRGQALMIALEPVSSTAGRRPRRRWELIRDKNACFRRAAPTRTRSTLNSNAPPFRFDRLPRGSWPSGLNPPSVASGLAPSRRGICRCPPVSPNNVPRDDPALSPSRIAAGQILACRARPKCDMSITRLGRAAGNQARRIA